MSTTASRAWMLLTLCGLAAGVAPAQFPTLELVPFLTGFPQPITHINHAGDGSGRLFIVGQPGRIRIFKEGALLDTPFLDITSQVLSGGERGLLSIAFSPNYLTNGYFYVYYTGRLPAVSNGDIVISRFRVSEDPDVADPSSETVLMTIPHFQLSNHNGGQLAFSPQDGYLYIGTGDGGGAGDTLCNAQRTDSLLGKMLRIEVDSAETYTIPPDNPFVGVEGYSPEIWALGMRNPWRFSFDRGTWDLYIADVGQNVWEEIDYQPAFSPGGQNYGWNIVEGPSCFSTTQCRPAPYACDDPTLILPIAWYRHVGGDCSVTGGFVYRGAMYPSMDGVYFYGDYCTGRIWGTRYNVETGAWDTAELLDSVLLISTFGEDELGNIYVADHGRGDIYLMTAVEAKKHGKKGKYEP